MSDTDTLRKSKWAASTVFLFPFPWFEGYDTSMPFLTLLQTAKYIFQFSECLACLPFQQVFELLNSTKLNSEGIETSSLVKMREIFSCWALSCKPSAQKQNICYLSWKKIKVAMWGQKKRYVIKGVSDVIWGGKENTGQSLSEYNRRFNFW